MNKETLTHQGAGNWTRNQLKLAFHFYCKTPFGKLDARNKDVIALANLIGRSPGALAMKCVNFASLDPEVVSSGRSGLSNTSKLDREVWDEFNADWEKLAIECELLLSELTSAHADSKSESISIEDDDIVLSDFSGETRQALVQQRIKQNFFRRAVLSSYRDRCCISGVSESRLLVASHIVPWSIDKKNRLNPSNGLCLSSIHDKAFDSYLFTLSDDFRVMLSQKILSTKDGFLKDIFHPTDGRKIELPERFVPDKVFIGHHREKFLIQENFMS